MTSSLPPLHYAPDDELLTSHAVELIWNAFPGYSLDVLDKEELIPSVRSNIALAIKVLRGGEPPHYDELETGRALGARRASQGVPLESVIQAYRSTERTIILDLFSDSQEWSAQLASRYVDLVISTFDRLTDEMINSYRETSSTIEAARHRLESELVTAVANGYDITISDLERWENALDVSPSRTYQAVCVKGATEVDQLELQRARRRLVFALQPLVSGPVLFGDLGGDILALFSPRVGEAVIRREIDAVLSSAGHDVWLGAGLGDQCDRLIDATASCQQARECAQISARDHSTAAALKFDDVLIDALLAARPAVAERLVVSRLDPLRSHAELLQTLEALISNDLSQTGAARDLFVHVNTVGNRIRKIGELTGHDPLNVSSLIEFGLALRWLRAAEAST